MDGHTNKVGQPNQGATVQTMTTLFGPSGTVCTSASRSMIGPNRASPSARVICKPFRGLASATGDRCFALRRVPSATGVQSTAAPCARSSRSPSSRTVLWRYPHVSLAARPR